MVLKKNKKYYLFLYIVMYWLYIFICLSVKYMIYGLTEKFHFSLIHTMELFAININLNNITTFYLPKIYSDIFVWIFFGISYDQVNYLNLISNYKLIYSIICLLPLLFLFLIKDFVKYYLYNVSMNIKSIILKFSLISFLPFLTLAIRDLIYFNTNSFINSFVAIFIISFMIIGVPAFIFDILYGKSKLRTRKKYYFLINNFTRNFKFMSLIHLLNQIVDSIMLTFYSFNPILLNSFLLVWKIIILVLNYNLFKRSYEDFSIQRNSIIFQISILILNYGFILVDSSIIKIILNIIYFLELLLYFIFFNNKFRNKEKKEDDNDIELAKIQHNIPDWAINEYLESFKESDDNIL